MKDAALLQQAKDALRDCLSEVPSLATLKVKGAATDSEGTPDLVLTVSRGGKEYRLVAEVKGQGEPRLARESALFILHHIRTHASLSRAYGVFIAPYVSPRSAAVCRELGIGYLDFAGNCRLEFDNVYIERSGHRSPPLEQRRLRSLYFPKATRVLRVLLLDPKRKWRLEPLAEEARVSLAHAFKVAKVLQDREWATRENGGFVLADPDSLLQDWSENYSFRKNSPQDYYSLKAPAEAAAEVAGYCTLNHLRYAYTGFSGAAVGAPMVRYKVAMGYVDGRFDEVATALDLKEVDSGANVILLDPYDEGAFYGAEERDGLNVVSPVQLYLDLKGYRGRGEEAAEEVLRTVIKPLW